MFGLEAHKIEEEKKKKNTNRFARIDSQKRPYSHDVRAIRANRLKPAIRNVYPQRSAIRRKRVQFGNTETIRANLRIDLRGSGHLSRGNPRKKTRVFLFAETPKILGKERKNGQTKQKQSKENRKRI